MMRFYKSLSGGVRRLVLFFVLSLIAINVVMFAALIGAPKEDLAYGKTALYSTARYVLIFLPNIHVDDDSWEPMHAAAAYFKTPHDKPLYQSVFFGEGRKFQYPPISLLFVAPMLNLPYDKVPSNRILNIVSWFAVVATAILVVRIFLGSVDRHLGPSFAPARADRLVLAGLALCATLTFYPIVLSFALGQIQTWLNCVFAAALLSWMSGRKGLAGALLALTCAIKPQLGLFLLWGALRKEWRFTGGMLLIGVPLGIASLAIYGLETHLDYLTVLSFLSRNGESFYLNQSVNGLLNRLLTHGPITMSEFMARGRQGWAPEFNTVVMLATYASSIAILAFALFWRVRERAGADLTDFMIAALSFTMATPVVWTHHYGVTLPMFAVLVPAVLARAGRDRAGLIWLAVAYLLIGNSYDAALYLTKPPLNVLLSYGLFGALVLLVLLYRLRRAQHDEQRVETVQRVQGQQRVAVA